MLGRDITPWLQIAPLAILMALVVFFVFRGLGRKGNDTGNRASGGGPGDGGGVGGLD